MRSVMEAPADADRRVDDTPRPRSFRRARRPALSPAHLMPLLLALVTAVLILAATKDRSAVTYVAVANHVIAPGSTVTDADVRWSAVHRSDLAVVAGLLRRSDLTRAWTAEVQIPAGQPIARSELTSSAATPGLGSMSLPLTPAEADGGALQPGDQVDVIANLSGVATYVAVNLEVLAVPDAHSTVFGVAQAGQYFVTVAVDRTTALKLAQALASAGTGAQSSELEVVRSTGEQVIAP